MKQEKQNIEEFLRDKLDGFDAGYQNDWSQFEDKLDRTIMHFRLKVGALIGVVLLLITLGIAGGEGISRLTTDEARTAAQPAFINSLRQRAPFLVNSRFPILTRYRSEEEELAEKSENSTVGTDLTAGLDNSVAIMVGSSGEGSSHAPVLLGSKTPAVSDLMVSHDPGLS